MNKEPIFETENILFYIENKPAFFARIEEIAPDIKKGWWRVKLLVLQVPLFVTTWILDDEQIRGADFTMNGTPIRIEKVVAPATPPAKKSSHQKEPQLSKKTTQKKARIVSLNPKENQTEK
ncbi:hypothetical protein L0Z72_03735 [candidate division KSB1 bacterium]|nr:hypothetical protein [candidate division KSB1 bacterium]